MISYALVVIEKKYINTEGGEITEVLAVVGIRKNLFLHIVIYICIFLYALKESR